MDRVDRRRRYAKPSLYTGLATACSATSRAIDEPAFRIALLAVGAGFLVLALREFARVRRSLPPAEQRSDGRQMIIGAVGAIVAIAVLTAIIMLIKG